jgi:hypothetical protein
MGRPARRAAGALPVLWSMHPLLALERGARIEVEGLVSVRVAWAAGMPLKAFGGWGLYRRWDAGGSGGLPGVSPGGGRGGDRARRRSPSGPSG